MLRNMLPTCRIIRFSVEGTNSLFRLFAFDTTSAISISKQKTRLYLDNLQQFVWDPRLLTLNNFSTVLLWE